MDPPVDANAFVKRKIKSGAFGLELVEVKRDAYEHKTRGHAEQAFIMEFVVDGQEKTFGANDAIKAAGFTHFSGKDGGGWHPAALARGRKGWGRPVGEPERIEKFNAEKALNTPVEFAGGWLFRGVTYTAERYPDADAHGPRGAHGPMWGSNFAGD